MPSVTSKLTWETLRVINSAALTGGYDALGAVLAHPSYILKMVNNSNALVTVSIDGATDIDVCPANSFWLYDESKFGDPKWFPAVRQGTQIYIKGTAGIGSIYLVSQYVIEA